MTCGYQSQNRSPRSHIDIPPASSHQGRLGEGRFRRIPITVATMPLAAIASYMASLGRPWMIRDATDRTVATAR